MECTKEQPGYYTDMLNELAKLDNTEPVKRVNYKSIQSARTGIKNQWVKYPDMILTIDGKEVKCNGCQARAGSIQALLFDGFEIPLSDYIGPVSIIVRKSIKEYIAQPKPAGSYKNCEGGGWYSMASLYELNGKFYTNAY